MNVSQTSLSNNSKAGEPLASAGPQPDVVVVGGGLAGLTAAAFAARGGARVLLLERAETLGGRAATHEHEGFRFNIGPHALYVDGAASGVLQELGVTLSGRRPPVSGGLAYAGGKLHALPGGFVSLLTSGFLTLAGKLEFGRALTGLGKLDATRLRGQTLSAWLDGSFRDPAARSLLESLLRLTSYGNDPGRACAAAAVEQLQLGMDKGVIYLDGGWATLVAGLRRAAEAAGVEIQTGVKGKAVRLTAGGVEIEWTRNSASSVGPRNNLEPTKKKEDYPFGMNGSEGLIQAASVVLALPPAAATAIVKDEAAVSLRSWVADAKPIHAACLDLGLRRLPNPRRLFALGMDDPLYFSVHSASAKLAPEAGALVHVAKYLDGGQAHDAKAVEAELEAFCDLVQPGWRDVVVERRYLPSMMVAGALVEVGKPRPASEVPGCPGLFLAGDWVGPQGMIADAAAASGREAGVLAARRSAAVVGSGAAVIVSAAIG